MQIVGLATKVTVYIGESDRWHRKPLYQAILELLRKEECAGATVTRALAGFGAHSRIHTASLVALSTDLPLVIEWIDSPARVERVMPRLREMVSEGLITVQDVEVVTYSHRHLRELSAGAQVQDIMSREVHDVGPDTPLAEAVEMLLARHYRTLPVTDEAGHVIGIFTDGDVLKRANLLSISTQQELTDVELARHLQALRDQGLTVGEVMSSPVVTVTMHETVANAVQRMVEQDVKRLPVVDEGGQLVGMVSRVDVLRTLAQPPVAEIPRPALPAGSHVTAGEVMMTQVPAVPRDASLAQVVDLLVSAAQRRVVVLDGEGQVAGIITDGDLIRRATDPERAGIVHALTERVPVGEKAAGFRLQQRTAADVMTSHPVCIHPDTPLSAALELLLEHRIKRLPVVDQAGRLVGLLGRGGVLQALSRELRP